MTFFRFKIIRGQKYLYIAESRREGERIRSVTLAYLGKADHVLGRLQGPEPPKEALRSFEHGAVAVLLSLAEQLGVVELIEHEVHPPGPCRPRRHILSVGQTLLLAAIGRALHPTSKQGWAEWAEGTTLGKFWGFDPARITSQFFWDQMDRLPATALESLQVELAGRLRERFGLSTESLFYDATNFFTFIDSRNQRCDLPQRGKNKQHRGDLRQFQLGLLVSRDGWVPLLAVLFRGNQNDVTSFPAALAAIRRQCAQLGIAPTQVTVVADKGNLSRDNWQTLDASGLGYVVSLTPGHFAAWTRRAIEDYQPCAVPGVGSVKLLRGQEVIADRPRTVIALDSPSLRHGQMRGLQQQFGPVMRGFNELQQTLARATRRRRQEGVERQIARVLAPYPQVRRVVRTALLRRGPREGFWALDWWVDEAALADLRDRQYGRRILATNRQDWPDAEVIRAYWGQSEAELVFRQLKDPEFLALRPQYHWTDQKIRVHSFCCLLGYLLVALLRRQSRRAGLEVPSWGAAANEPSAPTLLKALRGIRAVLRTATRRDGRLRARWQLEQADPAAWKVYRAFVLPRYDVGTTPADD
jgi:hypothetical protein